MHMYKIRNLLSLLKVYKHCNDYCCRDSDNYKWKNRCAVSCRYSLHRTTSILRALV